MIEFILRILLAPLALVIIISLLTVVTVIFFFAINVMLITAILFYILTGKNVFEVN